jgi:glutathione synthase/RimK-type ligase-like ATP-grasp enzyme
VILVISHRDDDHAPAVLNRLEAMGATATLLDLAQFPRLLRLSMACSGSGGASAALAAGDGQMDLRLDDCRAIWWRRPQPFEFDPAIQDRVALNFARHECHLAIAGLWPTLAAFWVNRPQRDESASGKAYQLKVAGEVGLEIPETLITNDPESARRFSLEHGAAGTVYKTFSGTADAWRETRLLKDEELDLLDAVALAPVIFQEYVPAAVDLRVTMIDGTAFAAAIHSQDTPYKVDYRMHMDEAAVEPYSLPEPIVERLRLLMGRLGLVYGAIDLRLTPDGRFVFFEVNPSGQWLFIEERTGLPITENLAQLLAARDRGEGP